ncbi:hypothetical protein V7S43_007308 [Phytophthora oleae]|uniref:Uncharacterized protein n=1 Tax=Phytophthora oleae TaxID=2107226 RepID=A0ABD3FLH5_9STRA
MHYLRGNQAEQLEAGSSDGNYSFGFGANMAPACNIYQKLIAANMDADPEHTPRFVQRPLDAVNQFLGSVWSLLQ